MGSIAFIAARPTVGHSGLGLSNVHGLPGLMLARCGPVQEVEHIGPATVSVRASRD